MDVPRRGVKVAGVADEAVPVIFLPELALAAELAVDFTGGEALEPFDDIGKGKAFARGHENVDVVGHDDVFKYVVTHRVKLQPGVDDYISDFGNLETAGAIAAVKMIFDALTVGGVAIGGVGFGDLTLEKILRQ